MSHAWEPTISKLLHCHNSFFLCFSWGNLLVHYHVHEDSWHKDWPHHHTGGYLNYLHTCCHSWCECTVGVIGDGHIVYFSVYYRVANMVVLTLVSTVICCTYWSMLKSRPLHWMAPVVFHREFLKHILEVSLTDITHYLELQQYDEGTCPHSTEWALEPWLWFVGGLHWQPIVYNWR